jgi:8-oxo-dGTP diphosphatase
MIGNRWTAVESKTIMVTYSKSLGKAGYSYRHPHPAVTVDLAVFTIRESRLSLLLIRRGREPFKGDWALPGGFVRINEPLREAAARELEEETGLKDVYLKQIGAFGDPERDPRERVISIAYFAVVDSSRLRLAAGTDSDEARWWQFSELPRLAFDHHDIVASAHAAVREELQDSLIAFQFLAPEFTLTELQQVHEAIGGEPLDKRNFRKWAVSQNVIKSIGRQKREGQHRPAALYRVRSEQKARQLVK